MKFIRQSEPMDFDAWSGAKDTLRRIEEADKEEEFNNYAEEMWPDGVDETTYNDWLWFDSDTILEDLGISDEEDEE